MSEYRVDPIFGTISIIARERATRPQRTRAAKAETEPTGTCPLCPGNEGLCPPEVARLSAGQGARWQVRAFPNRYPAVNLEAEPDVTDVNMLTSDLEVGSHPGFGVHEVIVESPNHTIPFWGLDPEQGVAAWRLVQNRIRDLYQDERIFSIQVFKNYRAPAGETLEHPHLQLLGLSFAPEPLMHLLTAPQCLVCDHLRGEKILKTSKANGSSQSNGSDGSGLSGLSGLLGGASAGSVASERLMAESARFAVLADFAPQFAYQFSVYPKQHRGGFEDASTEDLEDLVQTLSLVLGRYERLLGEIPLNISLFTQPNPRGRARPMGADDWKQNMHWFIRVYPRLQTSAGFEIATGLQLVQVAPEDAARVFKEKGL